MGAEDYISDWKSFPCAVANRTNLNENARKPPLTRYPAESQVIGDRGNLHASSVFVSGHVSCIGHDFNRAVITQNRQWALAPAVNSLAQFFCNLASAPQAYARTMIPPASAERASLVRQGRRGSRCVHSLRVR